MRPSYESGGSTTFFPWNTDYNLIIPSFVSSTMISLSKGVKNIDGHGSGCCSSVQFVLRILVSTGFGLNV